jgi:hypothetical protein
VKQSKRKQTKANESKRTQPMKATDNSNRGKQPRKATKLKQKQTKANESKRKQMEATSESIER